MAEGTFAAIGPTEELSPARGRPSNSLHFVVGEMSGKLDQVLGAVLTERQRVDARFGEVDGDISKVAARVTLLETYKWRIIGGSVVLVALVGPWKEVLRYVNP